MGFFRAAEAYSPEMKSKTTEFQLPNSILSCIEKFHSSLEFGLSLWQSDCLMQSAAHFFGLGNPEKQKKNRFMTWIHENSFDYYANEHGIWKFMNLRSIAFPASAQLHMYNCTLYSIHISIANKELHIQMNRRIRKKADTIAITTRLTSITKDGFAIIAE